MAVVVDHAFLLSGPGKLTILFWSDRTLGLGALAVVVFFAASGYLVAASWMADPRLERFVAKRVVRLWPGLAVLVLLTTFVAGPLLSALPPQAYFANPDTWAYLRTVTLAPVVTQLPGVFATNPLPLTVNGS